MTDAEALEMLQAFEVHHSLCGEQAISTEFSEDRDTENINVTKRCQKCNAVFAVTVTKGAAAALLRKNT